MSKINIKEQNKGKFTAWAKSHGMSVQQAAATILRNREKYSPTLIKRANFARNAAKWDDGGMFGGPGDPTPNKTNPNWYPQTDFNVMTGMGIDPKAWSAMSGVQRADTVNKVGKFAGGGFMDVMEGAASVLGPVGSAFSLVGGVVDMFKQGAENRRKAKLAEEQRITSADDAQNLAQSNISNQYAATFNTGGMFKGKKFGGTPNAIVGGGEMVMTPDGVATAMEGPSDMNGGKGIPVQMPHGTIIINKKDSKEVLPLTKKINKNKEVMAKGGTYLAKNSSERNLNKYYSKVLDVYNKQEAKKFAKGGQYVFDGGGLVDPPKNSGPNDIINPYDKAYFYDPTAEKNLDTITESDAVLGNMHPYDGPTSMTFGAPLQDLGAGAPKNTWGTIGNVAEGLGSLAPTLYNLGQGLFGKRQKIDPNRYRNQYEGSINSLMSNRRYNIDAPLASNEAAYRTNIANMRNLGIGGGKAIANMTSAQNTKQFGDMTAYGQQTNMNNQYLGEQANMQYGLGRDWSATRMGVDEGNMMTDASGRNMTGASMTGIQQYLLTRRQMKNQSARDKMLADAIKGYSPYASKWIPGLDA